MATTTATTTGLHSWKNSQPTASQTRDSLPSREPTSIVVPIAPAPNMGSSKSSLIQPSSRPALQPLLSSAVHQPSYSFCPNSASQGSCPLQIFPVALCPPAQHRHIYPFLKQVLSLFCPSASVPAQPCLHHSQLLTSHKSVQPVCYNFSLYNLALIFFFFLK